MKVRLAFLVALALLPSVRAQFVYLNGGTNNVAAATTNSYTTYGVFGTSRALSFSLTAQFLGGGLTNSGNMVATFDSSTDGTSWSLGVLSATVAISGTSANTAITSIDSQGVTAWRLASVSNTNQWLSLTNVIINCGYKPGDSGGLPTGTASGDLSGTYPSPTIATITQGGTKILTAGQHLTNITDIASSTAVAQVLSGTNTEFIGGGTFDNIKSTNAVDAASYTLGGSAFVATGGGNVNLTGHLVEGTVDITTLTSGSLVNTNAITTGSLAAVTNVTSAAIVGTNSVNGGIITAATNFVGEAGGLTEALVPTNSTQLATKAYVDAAIPSSFTYYFYGSSNNTTMSGLVQPLRSTNWAYASPASLTANTNTISSATNATYIAAYVTADTFRQLSSGNVNMDIYASFNTGAGRAAAIHPEIYLYDTVGNSNIIEFPNAPPDQSLSGTLALYTFSVAITNFTWTNPFRVICKVKATTTNLPDISLVTQSNFTSHIDFNVPGGVFVQKAGDTMTGTLIGPTGEFADLRTGTLINTNGTMQINGITYTWPSTNGLNSQILRNDGSGGLTWTNPPSGGGALANTVLSPGTATTANAVAVFSDTTGTNITQSSGITTSGNTNLTATGLITANYGLVPGSFTTANLWAIPSPATGKMLYCTDCLKPDGVGSTVIYDGSYWRMPNGILATTTNLDYCRSWAAHGTSQRYYAAYDTMADGPVDVTGASASFPNGSSGTGANVGVGAVSSSLTNMLNMPLTVNWGTTASGAAFVGNLLRAPTFKVQSLAFAYLRCEYYWDANEDGSHVGWYQIGFGSQAASVTTTPPTGFVGMLLDPTNVWGFNAGTANKAQYMVKAGATATNWTFAAQPPETSVTARGELEILMEPGQVTFLTNGVQESVVSIGNYYPTNTALWPTCYAVSTTANSANLPMNIVKFNSHVRLKAPYSIPISGTLYP